MKAIRSKGQSGEPVDPEILKNTIFIKQRELRDISRRANQRRGLVSQEVEEHMKSLQDEIEELNKELLQYRKDRLDLRRRSEAERGVVTMANGGYMKR